MNDRIECACAMCRDVVDVVNDVEFEAYMPIGGLGVLCETCVGTIVAVARQEGMV